MKFAAPYGASPGGFPCPESCPGQLSPVPSPSLAVLVGALVYPDHGAKRHQIALPPRLRRIETCRASSVQESSVLTAQLVSEKSGEFPERNFVFRDGEHQHAGVRVTHTTTVLSRSAVPSEARV